MKNRFRDVIILLALTNKNILNLVHKVGFRNIPQMEVDHQF